MTQPIHHVRVAPSRAVSAVLAVLGALFLVFGIALVGAGVADTDDATLRLLLWLFGCIWSAACLSMVGYGLYGLVRKKPPVVLSVGIEEAGQGRETESFDARLRKLRALREEGLISQEEYEKKRAEIMGERW
jgi:hypothetical protein